MPPAAGKSGGTDAAPLARRRQSDQPAMDPTQPTTRSPCSRPGWRRPRQSEPNDPNAMCLATATPDGRPSARMVLLKGVDAARLRLLHQPRKPQGRRAGGQPQRRAVLPLEDACAAACASRAPVEPVTRGRGGCLLRLPRRAARASAPGPSGSPARWKARFALEKAVAEYTLKFGLGEIPRPAFWSGFRRGAARGSSSGATCPSACTTAACSTASGDGLARSETLYP